MCHLVVRRRNHKPFRRKKEASELRFVLNGSVISCSWVYQWMLTNIPLLLMRNSPCFLIAVMLPSICGHESSLQECCSVFVLCENVRLGDGYTFDKHLSRVSLTCFIMRTRWLDIFLIEFLNTPHTLPMIPYYLLLHWWSVSWCIVVYRTVDICNIVISYRGKISVSWHH